MNKKNALVLGGGAFTGFAYESGCILALNEIIEKPKIKDFD